MSEPRTIVHKPVIHEQLNMDFTYKHIVGSQGDVQLGGPALDCAIGVPLRLRLTNLLYSYLFTHIYIMTKYLNYALTE